MQACIHCLPCLLRQAISAAEQATTDSDCRTGIVQRTLRSLVDLELQHSPPYLARRIYDIVAEETGNEDPFAKVKATSNRNAMALLPKLQQLVNDADDPFVTGLRLAIAGNIIDFGIPGLVVEGTLEETVQHAAEAPLPKDVVEHLRRRVESAKRILYLGDNAGEIILDRLFIEQLPMDRITFAVRGRAIINDALTADAQSAGLTGRVKIISNGTGYPGTVLAECSSGFQHAFHHADLIISKGQGNFETLSEAPKDIFFLLKVKCEVVAERLQKPLGTVVLHHQPAVGT